MLLPRESNRLQPTKQGSLISSPFFLIIQMKSSSCGTTCPHIFNLYIVITRNWRRCSRFLYKLNPSPILAGISNIIIRSIRRSNCHPCISLFAEIFWYQSISFINSFSQTKFWCDELVCEICLNSPRRSYPPFTCPSKAVKIILQLSNTSSSCALSYINGSSDTPPEWLS